MTNETPRTANVVHLLVADLSRTACQMPATPALNATTIADNATCEQCRRNSGLAAST